MSLGPFRKVLIAFALGSLLGVAVFLFERLVSRVAVPPEAGAGYSLLGGLLAAIACGVLGRGAPSGSAAVGSLGVIGAYASLYLLYFINVRALPGDHYLSLRSLTMLGELIERVDPGDDASLVDKALAWAQRARGPFFLYVHLMDSHTPYRSPPIDGKRRAGRRIEFPFTGMPMTAEEAEDVVARYDGGIRSADAQVGRLIDAASTWGRPFIAVITSDHGESLGESGRWFHGGSLAPELLAIPMLVVGDGVPPGRVGALVGHASVMPTLLAGAGLAGPDCTGIDLRSGDGAGRAEGGLPPHLFYRIVGDYKLVLDRATGVRQLFDLRSDPEEKRDIARDRPGLASILAEGLAEDSARARPSPEEFERIRALGYVSP